MSAALSVAVYRGLAAISALVSVGSRVATASLSMDDGTFSSVQCLALEEVDETMDPIAPAQQGTLADWLEDSALPLLEGCQLTLDGRSPESWARDLWQGMPLAVVVKNGHTDKSGRWVEYEQIPRRADRPDSYATYSYPVAGARVVSGYDLDEPDAEQRRGKMNAVGHGGVDLVAPIGTPIEMLRLEHQRINPRELRAEAWRIRDSIATDPRNVLPLRAGVGPAPSCVLIPLAQSPRYWLRETMTLGLD